MNRRDQWACFCFSCYVFSGIALVGLAGKVAIQRVEAARARKTVRQSAAAGVILPHLQGTKRH